MYLILNFLKRDLMTNKHLKDFHRERERRYQCQGSSNNYCENLHNISLF